MEILKVGYRSNFELKVDPPKPTKLQTHGPLTRYVKLRVAHAPGMPGTFPPCGPLQRKSLVSDPGMHHGTCVTHVPWCMSGSLTRCGRENVPGIPGACAPAILRIWQEAHGEYMIEYIYVGCYIIYARAILMIFITGLYDNFMHTKNINTYRWTES